MELKILYDNAAKPGFRKGWGFSCLVGEDLLFDTGGDATVLGYNMRRFPVNLGNIRRIVLSHEHGDHVGGIRIVQKFGDVKVFVPASFSRRFKRRLTSYPNINLIEVTEARSISQNIVTIGELGSFIKEQSLLVRTDNGLTVITGCSHPGLERILEAASNRGKIYGVVGGFHGFTRLKALSKLRLIVPCHCTKRKKEILGIYPEASLPCSAGCEVEI